MSPNAGCPNANVKAFQVVTANSINVSCPLSAPTGSNAISGPTTLYNINPVAIKILQLSGPNGGFLIPSTNASGFINGQTFTNPAFYKDHNGLGNLDYQINTANTLSIRYEYEADPISAPFPVLNANLPGAFLPGSPVTTDKSNQSGVVRLTSIITPNLVNEAHIAYQRYVVLNAVGIPDTNSQVGVKDLSPGSPQGDVLSYFNITGAFGFGGQYQFPGYWPDNQFQYADQISWNHGKHTFRAGFEAIRIQVRQDDSGNSIGSPTFSSFADFLIGRCALNSAGCTLSNNTTGSNVNTVGTFAQQNAQYPYYYRALGLDGFVQDDIKVTPRLTLNLGVRWEYDGWPTVNAGIYTDIWTKLVSTVPLPPTSAAGGTLAGFAVPANYSAPLPSGIVRSDNNGPVPNGAPRDNFAPRVGFAWQPTGSDKWVLRGGFGMFYDVLPGNVITGNAMGITSPAIVPPTIGGSPRPVFRIPGNYRRC